jgi:hypothetical protein
MDGAVGVGGRGQAERRRTAVVGVRGGGVHEDHGLRCDIGTDGRPDLGDAHVSELVSCV